jgi:hypothetical protein
MRAMLDLMQERIVQKGLPSIGVEPNRLQWRSRLSHCPPQPSVNERTRNIPTKPVKILSHH